MQCAGCVVQDVPNVELVVLPVGDDRRSYVHIRTEPTDVVVMLMGVDQEPNRLLWEKWSPSFGQLSGQIKVKSGFIDQAASGCDEVGQSPGLGVTPTLYASSGVRSPSDECGRRLL